MEVGFASTLLGAMVFLMSLTYLTNNSDKDWCHRGAFWATEICDVCQPAKRRCPWCRRKTAAPATWEPGSQWIYPPSKKHRSGPSGFMCDPCVYVIMMRMMCDPFCKGTCTARPMSVGGEGKVNFPLTVKPRVSWDGRVPPNWHPQLAPPTSSKG